MIGNKAIEHGLLAYDKRHGWRKPARNVLAEGHTIDGFKEERWSRPMAVGDVVPAVVVAAAKTGPARLRIGTYHADLAREGFTCTRMASTADLFKPGDLVAVAIVTIDDGALAA